MELVETIAKAISAAVTNFVALIPSAVAGTILALLAVIAKGLTTPWTVDYMVRRVSAEQEFRAD